MVNTRSFSYASYLANFRDSGNRSEPLTKLGYTTKKIIPFLSYAEKQNSLGNPK